MKHILLIVLLILSVKNFAQQKTITLDWEGLLDNTTINSGVQAIDQALHFMAHDEKGWVYQDRWKVQSSIQETSIEIRNINYETVPSALLKYIGEATIPSTFEYSLQSTQARGEVYASLELSPFVRINGQLQRVVSFDITYAFAKAQSRATQLPITNSILASGDIFRFYVEETGVYRITRSFLNSLGMDTNVDPRTIKIYSHGGAPLPLLNSDNNEFDPPEIAIKVVGEEDGDFGNSDVILFYGEGTRNFHEELGTNVNPYAERSFYYITAGGNNGLRIAPMNQPNGTPNVTFTSFDDYQFVEQDLQSLVLVGRRWFGEQFNFENEQVFSFNFPNIIGSEPAQVRVEGAAISESQTSFDVAVNGAAIGSFSIQPITSILLARGNGLDEETAISSEEVEVTLTYNNAGNPSSTGYLDFISIEATRALLGTGNQIRFQNNDAATLSGIGAYTFGNASDYTETVSYTHLTLPTKA